MAASNFVYTVGSGLYLTAGVLYFTQAVHLPAPQVGLGLGIAGLLSLAVGIAVGHLADRRGARGVYAATLVVQALATAAATLLLAGVAVHTIGELWHAAAGFEVSFALAPERATGQYLGVFGLGAGLAEAAGPALIIFLCVTWGRPGWYVMGALFALTGLAAPFVVRWAERQRPAEKVQFDGEKARSTATA
ncbi:MFS transporter [Streptomyces vinaceus]|uniref:MFS transporter n=1 Tax=Streptomyces vinaceus TaxID=1960 RepID=UPI003682755A